MSTTSHLEKLNGPQRKAVTYGEPLPENKGFKSGPLLIVAGAGTGKTDTLAHRVAHLAMHGVDPGRILMLTFTRRAATEMRRRAQEIAKKALQRSPRRRRPGDPAATELGRDVSFHRQPAAAPLRAAPEARSAVHGARPRRFGRRAGRPAPGARPGGQGAALPAQRNLPADLLLPREHPASPSKETLEQQYPWCAQWEADLTRLYRAYVERKQTLLAARLRRPAAVLARHDVGAAPRAARRRALRPRPRRRIPGHQQAAGGDPARPEAGRRRTRRRRRRCAGDLLVPRGGGREHPRVPRPIQAARRSRHAGAELSLDPGSAGRLQCRDGARRRASTASTCWRPAGRGVKPKLVTVDDLQTQAEYICTEVLKRREANIAAAAPGGAVPQLQPQRRAGGGARQAEDSVREVRRPEVPRSRPHQGPARDPALGRQSA